ncbi:helix-turn-helix domain-containing protein [Neisseriaceae bacterium TC5R-5]|nr:helix-turn-helix domain-containing protein [Neisseriaceae bacterium TC5R-5]
MTEPASRVQYARSLSNMSQNAFANECGITQQALSKIELGKTTLPAGGTLKKIAAYTGLSFAWLLEGGPDPFNGSLQTAAREPAAVYELNKEIPELETLISELRLATHSGALPVEALTNFHDLLMMMVTQKKTP